MSVSVKLPTQLRASVGGEPQVEVEPSGDDVAAVLGALFEAHPQLREQLADEDGELRRFVNVYVGGEDIRFAEGLDTKVTDPGEIQILPAVAGG